MSTAQTAFLRQILLACLLLLLSGCGGPGNFTGTPNPGQPDQPGPALDWIELAGGQFNMGGQDGAPDAPEVRVELSAFTLSSTEVSNQNYVDFLNAAWEKDWLRLEQRQIDTPCTSRAETAVVGTALSPHRDQVLLLLAQAPGCSENKILEHGDNQSFIAYSNFRQRFELSAPDKAQWPVNWVSWYGADAFAHYYGLSLPTEAQWEFAARGGRQLNYPTTDGRLRPQDANYNPSAEGADKPEGHPQAVASYPANPYGLFDLGGNVWEWCLDYYDADFYADGRFNPVNLSPGPEAERVRRGGAWRSAAATLRSPARSQATMSATNNHTGFRVVSQ